MRRRRIGACISIVAFGLFGILIGMPGIIQGFSPQRVSASHILTATGVKGGLIVHLGCGDGRLTVALRQNDSTVVHGLDADPTNVSRARAYIRSLGLYGEVAVERWTQNRLPYADNLVNLIVWDRNSGRMVNIPMDEIMRVLAPGGIAYIKKGKRWTKTIKPHLADTDEWTHFLHDASGNAVAHDKLVGPPRRVQWIAEPRHTRSHEHTPSIQALVSAGGRIFYIADLASITSILEPPKWHLIARDAYNGILLWKRRFNNWFPHLCNWGATPSRLQRRLVAVGDRVFVTLGFHAPLSALDAATGKTLKVYPQTRGTEEIVYHQGILLLVVRKVTPERVAELAKWTNLSRQPNSPLFKRETAQPLLKEFRAIESKAPRELLAIDADTGKVLWRRAGAQVNRLRSVTLCASGNRVFYQNGAQVVCLELKSGRQVWSATAPPLRVVHDDIVICANRESIVALSAKTGKVLWIQHPLLASIRDAFIINGTLWLGGFKEYQSEKKRKRGPSWGPYYATQRSLETGEVLKHIEPENPGHHHRCWRNKATDRYILAGRRGVEFIDLETGEVLWHNWVRGVCRYGIMPSNGLLYAPPHACGCYIAAKLEGFYALASGALPSLPPAQVEDERLERGAVYGRVGNPKSSANASEWVTYRHDAQRSGVTSTSVPSALRIKWRTTVGGKLTSLTVADGKVFVSSVDEHRVCALDANSGRLIWDFIAGGRVDSPPTVYKGMAIFGCHDGYVYSVRISDGALVWRFRAARAQRRIIVRGQLESASPVFGSVLVKNGVAYFTAGRSSYLDGGIDLYRIDAETGKPLSRTVIYSPDPKTGKQPKQYGPAYMPGALADILTTDGEYVYLRDSVFDMKGQMQQSGKPHLFTLTGFLDETWAHRSYWIFGTRCSLSIGCSVRDRNLIYGRLLVFDDSTVYGYGRANVHWSNQLRDGAYRLFALKRDDRTVLWEVQVPIRVRAMLLADETLFIAGPRIGMGYDADTGEGVFLIAISAEDGRELARYPLESLPVLDGMAAANGRLYLTTQNGQVLCMGE